MRMTTINTTTMSQTPIMGFTNKYYTLWTRSNPYTKFVGGYIETKVDYTYYQNLSFDKDKALGKMNERYSSFEIDLDLRGNKSFFVLVSKKVDPQYRETTFMFGKYRGHTFDSINDQSYKVWYALNADSETRPETLLQQLVDSGSIFHWNGRYVTPEVLISEVSNIMKNTFYETGHFFANGDKVEIEAYVNRIGGFSTAYGYMQVVDLINVGTGQMVHIKGTAPEGIEVGSVVKIKGTVKHEAYNGRNGFVKQTALKRAKLVG